MHDAIVIGAGMSGLTAARDLHRAGADVLVLEAADRLGGRALSETTALGSRIDLGGQWIGHGHHRFAALADELGAPRFRMHTSMRPSIIDGARRVPPASPPVLTTLAALGAVAALARVGTAARWNDTTLHDVLRRIPGDTARRLLAVIANVAWTADLDRISVHFMAAMVRHQGGLWAALSTRGGAQDSLLVDGVGTLIDGLAAELGDRVRTGQRVTAITRDDDGVLVQTATGQLKAGRVIIAMAPPIAGRIEHHPALPAERVALQQNTYMGSVYKAIAVYERPFWRTGKGGEHLVLDGPGYAVFDSSPPDGPGHLTLLVGGAAARQLDGLDTDARRKLLLKPLATQLGPQLLTPADWHEKSWHQDEFVGGGYLALPIPGTTEGFPPMPHTPVGRIHWAGTETAQEHPGYLEGAIQAGVRAAAEVLSSSELARRIS